MNRVIALAALLSLTPACAWNSEWVFAATKDCYDGATHDGCTGPPSGWNQSGGKEDAAALAVFFLGLMVLPIAIDVACLPIEWTHDQLVCDD